MSTQLLHVNEADTYMGDVDFTLEATHHGPTCYIRPPFIVIDRVEVWFKETAPAAWTLTGPMDRPQWPGQPPVRPLLWETTTVGGSPTVQLYCEDAFTETVSFKIWGRQ